jgi:hypothetical protein
LRGWRLCARRLKGRAPVFEDKYLNTVVGTIVRNNQRTATIDPGDGTSWELTAGRAPLLSLFSGPKETATP